jgi:toxin ParE1/3/4
MASRGYSVVITEHAKFDIRETAAYISEVLKNRKAARDFTQALRKSFEGLREQPYMYPLSRAEQLASSGYRSYLVKNYLVLYLIDENIKSVVIARIIYGSRDYAELVLR